MVESVREAVANHWAQRGKGGSDDLVSVRVGRPGVAVLAALVDSLAERGVERSWIHVGRAATLPGAYGLGRSAWDLAVIKDGIPLAAIVLKTLGGPSYSNNYNNRIQELTSIAFDVRRQYGSQELNRLQPHLGLFFILQENERVNAPVRKPDDTYERLGDGLSYKERLGETFEQFCKDGLYDGVCYVSSGGDADSSFEEPRPEMSIDNFIAKFAQRVISLAQLQGATGVTAVAFGEMLARRSDIHEVLVGLTSTPTGMLAAESAVIRRRRTLLADLRKLALADDTNETRMQKALDGQYWIFGGQYIGIAARRDLMNLHQHDIPLISADRSLNIIELKGPEAPLVRRPRDNHLILSSAVHEAVGQCMNYLRTLDEMGAALGTLHRHDLNLDYDYRRARATVVIGYPQRAASSVTREQIDQTIRTYNAHLSRIQVLTYADLIDSAERALEFEEDGGQSSVPE
ncbi:Shedu anti-phage system protein SduA domain-containing protein [Streptomyces sp. NPDC051576]|uniref:Shedu anti-phage system protein SduA domain-containing protein n=1 Tax=Streptomyces sp. NPDC051576 TaxID=3155803 RepID=UPI00341A7C99